VQPLILILETATNVCSVALFRGTELLASEESTIQNMHSKNLLRFLQNIFNSVELKMLNLNAVAFSSGPGSYTGLRIGSSAAKAIAYTLDIPLISYDTLQSAAHALCKLNNYDKNAIYIAAIDARRDEVYVHIIDNQLNTLLSTTNLIVKPNSFNAFFNTKKIVIGGSANEKIIGIIKKGNIKNDEHNIFSSILSVDMVIKKYNQKQFADVAYSEPNYVKNFYTVAKKLLFLFFYINFI